MAPARLTEEQISDVVVHLEKADENHRLWLQSLHTSALCDRPFQKDVFSEHAHLECLFGKWYYSNGLSLLHTQPAYLELDALHREMHDSARHMARKLDGGEKLEVEEYQQFVERQRRFSVKLLQLRDSLREYQFAFDSLTGVMTRGPFMQALVAEIGRMQRDGEIASLALLDIDHFKSINDKQGHLMGDLVLKHMGQYLVRQLRPYDSVCRFGGEEFLLCLPYTAADEAVQVMDRIREEMLGLSGSEELQLSFPVTASVGVAQIDAALSIEENIDRADQALYNAKAAGRNRVLAFDPDQD